MTDAHQCSAGGDGPSSPGIEAMRRALTRRILLAWSLRFPNNAYAWPGSPEDFASAAAKVVIAAYEGTVDPAQCSEDCGEPVPKPWNVAVEECAKILDAAAADWHRIRDPGMANNAKSYARKIRALSRKGEAK